VGANFFSLLHQWIVVSRRFSPSFEDTIILQNGSIKKIPMATAEGPRKLLALNGSLPSRPKVSGFLLMDTETVDNHTNVSLPSCETRQQQPLQTQWAYAFLMAGVDVENPGYLGIFYNVLVSAEVLRQKERSGGIKDGSNNATRNGNRPSLQPDIIVMVQMSQNSTHDRLTKQEEDILTTMGVRIYYLDIPARQSFYTMQFEKFRILQMTEYKRIIFMDGDVLPFCSLDYLFELSDPVINTNHAELRQRQPLLKENLILTWRMEPAHGGFFMLSPKEGDYEQLQEIIHRRERQVMNGEDFDRVTGWGHIITPPDKWHSLSGIEGLNATLWSWHGDFADQGLLYYWTKYYKKNVSIVTRGNVENWSSDGSTVLSRALSGYGCVRKEDTQQNRYANNKKMDRFVPYRDFRHFSGRSKPWLVADEVDMNNTYRFQDVQTPQEYWFFLFRRIIERFDLQIDPRNLHKIVPKTSFGAWPTFQMAQSVARAKFASDRK
jgi:hypothetical protein